LPDAAHAVGRFPVKAKLYTFPPKPTTKRRAAPRNKGALIGSPQTLAQTSTGWVPHPDEEGAQVHAWCGLWHAVLPGRLMRIVGVRREAPHCLNKPGQRKPPPPVEAFFRTDLSLSPQAILREYRDRWAVEIAMRDANAFEGLGQDQCSAASGNALSAPTRSVW
jgi:hypothetical protein